MRIGKILNIASGNEDKLLYDKNLSYFQNIKQGNIDNPFSGIIFIVLMIGTPILAIILHINFINDGTGKIGALDFLGLLIFSLAIVIPGLITLINLDIKFRKNYKKRVIKILSKELYDVKVSDYEVIKKFSKNAINEIDTLAKKDVPKISKKLILENMQKEILANRKKYKEMKSKYIEGNK